MGDMSIEVFSELLNTTQPYEIDEQFKFKNYFAVQLSAQSNFQVSEPILFSLFYDDGYFLQSELHFDKGSIN